jgi:hypothetical protein
VIVKENKRRMKKVRKSLKMQLQIHGTLCSSPQKSFKKINKNLKNIQVAFSRIRTQCCNNFNISANDNSG